MSIVVVGDGTYTVIVKGVSNERDGPFIRIVGFTAYAKG